MHSSRDDLALWAGGDLSPWRAFFVRWHLHGCVRCREIAAGFTTVAASLSRSTKPPSVNMPALEREMLGNIAVGLAAARCIDNVGAYRRKKTWRFVAAACATLIFSLGWLTHVPMAQTERLAKTLLGAVVGAKPQAEQVLARRTTASIAVKAGSSALTVMTPGGASSWVSGSRDLTASYVDEETGEVTVVTLRAQ